VVIVKHVTIVKHVATVTIAVMTTVIVTVVDVATGYAETLESDKRLVVNNLYA